MRNDQYFPHDATAGNNIKLMILIETEGARGYGVYWYLLEFLRQQADYKGKLKMLDMLARRVKTSRVVVKRIITEYALFAVEGELFYSPGLLERMQPLDSKRAAKSEQCRQAAGAKWLKTSDGTSAGALQEEERREENKKRREEENSSSSNSSKEETSPRPSPEEREKEEEGNLFVSKTGIKPPPPYAYDKRTHNLEGLMSRLDSLEIWEAKDVNAILSLSDYGRMGGAVWKLLYHTKWERIKQPGRFLIAGLR